MALATLGKFKYGGSVKLYLDLNPKFIQEFANTTKQKAMRGCRKAAEYLLEESQPLVPVDTGRLRASGKVVEIPKGYSVVYSTENPETGYNYAMIQHENLEYHHEVGQAKYLEEPFRRNADKLISIVREEMRK